MEETQVRQTRADADRAAVQDLHASLLQAFPDLPPGVVLGTVTRVRRDLARLGSCEGLWDAVELAARARLLDLLQVRGAAVAPA